MESNQSYYARRAAQEAMAASRAIMPNAQAWHRHLAEEFSRKAQEAGRQFASLTEA
jgi:hypothetical protein